MTEEEDRTSGSDLMLVHVGGALDSDDCRYLGFPGRATRTRIRSLFGSARVMPAGQTDGSMTAADPAGPRSDSRTSRARGRRGRA